MHSELFTVHEANWIKRQMYVLTKAEGEEEMKNCNISSVRICELYHGKWHRVLLQHQLSKFTVGVKTYCISIP